MKPETYHLPYVVHHVMHYTPAESTAQADAIRGGWLEVGETVWLEHKPAEGQVAVVGYANDIGLIEADARVLHRS